MTKHKNTLTSSIFIWSTLFIPPLFWAGNFIVGRIVHDEVPPLALSLARWGIAFLCLLPFSYKIIKSELKIYNQFRWTIIGTSVVGIAAYNTFLYLALKTTTASNALLLNSLTPLFIILLSAIIYKNKIYLGQFIGIFLSFYGVVSLVLKGSISEWNHVKFVNGDLIILFSAILWAIYTIWLRKLPPTINRLGLLCFQTFIAVIFLIPFAIIENHLGIKTTWSFKSLLSALYVGIFASAFAFILYMYAINYFGPSKASLCIHLAPMYGVILSITFLNEKLYSYQIIGIIFIAVGLLFSTIPNETFSRIPLLKKISRIKSRDS